MTSRRGFILGAASILAAPAIVRVENIMPLFVPKPPAPSVLMPITATEVALRQIKHSLMMKLVYPPMMVQWAPDPLRPLIKHLDQPGVVETLREVNRLLEAYPSA